MAQSYENLKVWQLAIAIATDIYRITKLFPRDEQFGITSQIRRAVTSISANIAEGSSRKSKKDYARFIEIAIGSTNEVENFLFIARNLMYLKETDYNRLREDLHQLGIQLGGFKKYLIK